MTELLKEAFPQHNICDLSHLPPIKLFKTKSFLTEKNNKKKNIVFINKNEINKDYVNLLISTYQKLINTRDVRILIVHNERLVFFRDMNDLKKGLQPLKRTINEDNTCPICLDEMDNNRKVKSCLICGIQIHRDCFDEYIEKSTNMCCPNCRTDFRSMC